MFHSASPSVLKTAYFAFVAPDDFVIAVTEKRRVEID
jgi:hypothetical protein